MSDRPHPILIGIAALVYLFLMLPLVIVVGAALSDTTYLTFPPQGLSLRWFQNIFEISAFRRTIVTSLQIALLGTLIALLIGIPAAYALNRYRIELPKWLGTLFVLPILVPEIVFGFALLKSLTVGTGAPIFLALLIGHTLIVLPYVVRVISASLASFDFSIEEAAISLGSAAGEDLLHHRAAECAGRGDRGLHPRLHHLAQRRVGLALPHRAGHQHPADPDPRPCGAVLRSDRRVRFRAADVPHRRP